MKNIRHRLKTYLLSSVMALSIAGCATVPSELEPIPEQGPTVQQATAAAENYNQQSVYWGGTIVSVENKSDHSLVEVVSRPLARTARPVLNDRSDGRFIAHIGGFIDPGIYSADREISVVGTLDSILEKSIGSFNYKFPVVTVQRHHLWKKRAPAYNAPYGYPYYPYYPNYPYYGRPYHPLYDPYFNFIYDPYGRNNRNSSYFYGSIIF